MSYNLPDIIPSQSNGGATQPEGGNGSLSSDHKIQDALIPLQEISKYPNFTHCEMQKLVFEVIRARPNVRNHLELIERSKLARKQFIREQDDTKSSLDGVESKLKNTCIS